MPTTTSEDAKKTAAQPGPRPPTWRELVRTALVELDGEASLQALYAKVQELDRAATTRNVHWKAKVRQVVQLDPRVERVPGATGVWRLEPLHDIRPSHRRP